MYPNLSDGYLNLSIVLNQDSKLQAEVVDCTGRKIQEILKEENYPAGELTISQQLNTITEGLYFVRITINGQQSLLKWVIEN